VHSDDNEIEGVAAFFHGWAMEAIQVGPRLERTLVSCNSSRSTRTLRLEAGSAMVLRGRVHESSSCVLLSASPDPAARFMGIPLRVTDLVLAGADAQINLFVPSAAIIFVLVVQDSGPIPRRALRLCDDAATLGLAQQIKQQHTGKRSASLATQLEAALEASRVLPVASARVAAVMSACKYIESRFPAALTLSDISRKSGIGERTLEYGFREVCDTTPLTFARSLRLTRSRMALVHAGRYTPINETAKAAGFTHMGQFSRDYFRWFGETPSTTLARARPNGRSA